MQKLSADHIMSNCVQNTCRLTLYTWPLLNDHMFRNYLNLYQHQWSGTDDLEVLTVAVSLMTAVGSWLWHCSIVWSCDQSATISLRFLHANSIGKPAESFKWWQSKVICLTTASQSAGISVNKCTIMWNHTLLLCFLVMAIPVPITSLCKDYLYRQYFWRKDIHGYNTI